MEKKLSTPFLHRLVIASVNLVWTLENVLCTSRDSVPVGWKRTLVDKTVYQINFIVKAVIGRDSIE
jgi:hypothetical protein